VLDLSLLVLRAVSGTATTDMFGVLLGDFLLAAREIGRVSDSASAPADGGLIDAVNFPCRRPARQTPSSNIVLGKNNAGPQGPHWHSLPLRRRRRPWRDRLVKWPELPLNSALLRP
jgi:hypothetical protein